MGVRRVIAVGLSVGVLAGLQAGEAAAAGRPAKQEFEARVDGYPAAKRAELRAHLRRALSRLRAGASKYEQAAAINAYVFQRLRVGPTRPDGVTGLRDGFGRCGGAAAAMVELLYLDGIRSRHAALLGIPFQGNHSLVEAYFRRGREGLFDPTFGVFWYSTRRKRPVPFRRLLADPAASSRTLFKSVGSKRIAAGDPIVPIESIGSGYRLRRNYAEHPVEAGRPQMDWRQAFTVRGGAGLANSGHPIRSRIGLRPGDSYGNERWDGSGAASWTALALSKDRSGLTLPWAEQLGDNPLGFDVVHSYRLGGLRVGRRYSLRLTLTHVEHATLTARRRGAAHVLLRKRLPELASVPAGAVAPSVEIPFTARHTATRLRVTTSGYARFQAIALR